MSASDEADVVTVLRDQRPDLLITDLFLPPLDGLEIVRRVRTQPDIAGTRVLLCASTPPTEDAQRRARTLGATRFINRPPEPEALLVAVGEALRDPPAEPIPASVLKSLEAIHQLLMSSELNERTAQPEKEIAERKRVELQLRESQQRLAGIVEAAMDAIISIDSEQRIVLFNAAAERMFDWPAAQVIGNPLDWLMPVRFRAAHANHVKEFLATGTTSRRMGELQPLCGLRADGKEFPIEVTISTVSLASGPLATAIVRDISRRAAAETALAASEARLRYVTEAAEIGYWDWDVLADRLEWSAHCKVIFGIPTSEPMSYARFVAALHPDDRPHVEDAVHSALTGGGDYDIECRTLWPDGRVRCVHTKGRVTFDGDGRPLRMGGIALDITARKETEQALQESERRLTLALQAGGAAVWEMDVAAGVVHDRGQITPMLGYAPGQFTTATAWMALVHEDDRNGTEETMRQLIDGRRDNARFELRIRARDGAWRWILVQAIVAERNALQATRIVGASTAIDDRKHAEEMLRQSSLRDPLTHLPNRALALEFCEQLLAGSRRGHVQCAVMFIDLDHFKPINDTHGHHIGDAVLKEVAQRLRTCLRREDVVGRLGGDEFLAVLSHIEVPDGVTHAAANIVTRLSEPYTISRLGKAEPLKLETSPSIGISLFPDHGEDIDTLIQRADAAMYRAKATGRGRFRIFADKGEDHSRS